MRQVNEPRKWCIQVGGLTATLATQGATPPQGPLVVGDEEGGLGVFVRVDEVCVIADVADDGVLLGDADVLVPDDWVGEVVGTDPPLPDNELLMNAAKFPFSMSRRDKLCRELREVKVDDARYAEDASQNMTPPKDEYCSRVWRA
jgi:hypothetical protein